MCLPTSCTSNEADIALMISMVGNAEGESEGAAACTGSYTYDGLGDGTPDSVSCKLDMIENGDTFTEFYFDTFTSDCIPYLFPGAGPLPEECQPDYTAMQTICQDNGDSMDYFTASFTETCVDGSGQEDMSERKDFPFCVPSSCTSDKAALKAIIPDMMFILSDVGPVCTISDFIFSGLAKTSKKSKKEGKAATKAKHNKTAKKTRKVWSNGGD